MTGRRWPLGAVGLLLVLGAGLCAAVGTPVAVWCTGQGWDLGEGMEIALVVGPALAASLAALLGAIVGIGGALRRSAQPSDRVMGGVAVLFGVAVGVGAVVWLGLVGGLALVAGFAWH